MLALALALALALHSLLSVVPEQFLVAAGETMLNPLVEAWEQLLNLLEHHPGHRCRKVPVINPSMDGNQTQGLEYLPNLHLIVLLVV